MEDKAEHYRDTNALQMIALALAFVTTTLLFVSSGNRSFSTPADAECNPLEVCQMWPDVLYHGIRSVALLLQGDRP